MGRKRPSQVQGTLFEVLYTWDKTRKDGDIMNEDVIYINGIRILG